jgi:hypothetical protein
VTRIQRSLVEKVNAAIHFGAPGSVAEEIMSELTPLYKGDPSHPTIARVEAEAFARGEATEATRLAEQSALVATIRELVVNHQDDDCATEEAATLLNIAQALGYGTYGYGAEARDA